MSSARPANLSPQKTRDKSPQPSIVRDKSPQKPVSTYDPARSPRKGQIEPDSADFQQQGMLMKMGHVVHNWKERRFVLYGEQLSYYTPAEKAALKGTVNLARATCSIPQEGSIKAPAYGTSALFEVSVPEDKKKKFVFCAKTSIERDEWIGAINSAKFHGEARMLYDKFKPIVLPLHEAKQRGAVQDARSQWELGNQLVLTLKDEKYKFYPGITKLLALWDECDNAMMAYINKERLGDSRAGKAVMIVDDWSFGSDGKSNRKPVRNTKSMRKKALSKLNSGGPRPSVRVLGTAVDPMAVTNNSDAGGAAPAKKPGVIMFEDWDDEDGNETPLVLVTGATGNVGAHVVRFLLKNKARVRAAVRDSKKNEAQQLKALGAELVEVDFANPDSLDKACEDVDKMALIVALSPDHQAQSHAWVNAAKQCGVAHITKLSAANIDGGHIELARWHLEIEDAIKHSGLTWSFVRPVNFTQNIGNYMAQSVKTQGHIYGAYENAKVAWIDGRDVAGVIALATLELKHAYRMLTITGREALGLAEVAALLTNLLGKPVTYVNLPPEQVAQTMLSFGTPKLLVDALAELDGVVRAGYQNIPTDSVREITGHDAHTVEQYLRENLQLFKSGEAAAPATPAPAASATATGSLLSPPATVSMSMRSSGGGLWQTVTPSLSPRSQPSVRHAPKAASALQVLVTGATGNVGVHTVHHLLKNQVKVRAAVRNRSKSEAQALQSQGAELVEADPAQPETLRKACEGIERMVLIAAFTPEHQAHSIAWIQAAKAAGVKHITKLSAAGIDGGQITLARWHLEIEAAIKEAGFAWCMIRPNSFFQNIGNYCGRSIQTQNAFYGPYGDGKVAYVDARDVGEVLALGATRAELAGKTISVNGPQALDHAEMAAIIGQAVHRDVKFHNVSDEENKHTLLGYGTPQVLVDALSELYGVMRAGYAGYADDSVKQLTGHDGRTFAQYVHDHLALFK